MLRPPDERPAQYLFRELDRWTGVEVAVWMDMHFPWLVLGPSPNR